MSSDVRLPWKAKPFAVSTVPHFRDSQTMAPRHYGHGRLRGLGGELVRRDWEVWADLDVGDVR